MTDTAPFRTGGYDRFRTMFTGEIQDDHRCERRNRLGAASEPPRILFEEFVGLFLGDEQHRTMGQMFDTHTFGAVSRAKEKTTLVIYGLSRDRRAVVGK